MYQKPTEIWSISDAALTIQDESWQDDMAHCSGLFHGRRLVQQEPVWVCDLLTLQQAILTLRGKGGKRGSEIQRVSKVTLSCASRTCF